MIEKIQYFVNVLQMTHRPYAAMEAPKIQLKIRQKYALVDVVQYGSASGKFMVELATGNIYGIKAYGVIHRGKQYGSVETVDQWNWSGYYPLKNK